MIEFTVPEGYNIIGEFSFKGFENLRKIILPKGITSIEKDAFRHCKNLEEINFPFSLTRIRDFVFQDCHKLKITTNNAKLIDIGQVCVHMISYSTVSYIYTYIYTYIHRVLSLTVIILNQ